MGPGAVRRNTESRPSLSAPSTKNGSEGETQVIPGDLSAPHMLPGARCRTYVSLQQERPPPRSAHLGHALLSPGEAEPYRGQQAHGTDVDSSPPHNWNGVQS